MDLHFLVPVVLFLAGGLALVLRLLGTQRRVRVDTIKARVHRGTGHAMLGLREFVEPSVEYNFQAESAEQKEEDDLNPSGDDREEILAGLSTSLGRDPVDHEEVRRYLASARFPDALWIRRATIYLLRMARWNEGRKHPHATFSAFP
jgi:hypothetical protein